MRLIFCATFCGTLSSRSHRTLDHKEITELLLVTGKPVIFFCIYFTNLCLSPVPNSSKVTQEAEMGSPGWQLVLWHAFGSRGFDYRIWLSSSWKYMASPSNHLLSYEITMKRINSQRYFRG